MGFNSRRDLVFLTLAGFFITNAIVAELAGGKLIYVGPFLAASGVVLWPVVFLTTDLINEYYGREGVKKLTYLTIGLIMFAFAMVFAIMQIPAADVSPVKDEAYNSVFGTSLWIIVGSIVAFLVSQLIDVSIFWFFRKRTGRGKLWLRATGSTAVSQLIDTFIVGGIAFYLPGKVSLATYVEVALTNYTYKLLVAVLVTPIIYGAHNVIDKYLGDKDSDLLMERAAADSVDV